MRGNPPPFLNLAKESRLDPFDWKILRHLREHGRASYVELAQAVHLSETSCQRRVKALEEAGVISGYAALINERALGLTLTVFVTVTLASQTEGLLASGCAAVAYETVTDARGGLPLLAPMSEVAGRIAVFSAAETLLKHNGGMGLLLCGVPGVAPARVAVLGGGVVGSNAARMAAGLGAEVVVLERSIPRMRELDDLYQGRILTRYSTLDAVEDEILKADVVVGAVLTAGAAAPKLVRREHLKQMKPGSVLVDVSIDQGGCFETSRPTTHAEPTYVVDGVVHYCVANMPGAAPRTSSEALGNATLPFGLALADKGLDALKDNVHLARGLNVLGGKITHPAVAEALGKPLADPYGIWG